MGRWSVTIEGRIVNVVYDVKKMVDGDDTFNFVWRLCRRHNAESEGFFFPAGQAGADGVVPACSDTLRRKRLRRNGKNA